MAELAKEDFNNLNNEKESLEKELEVLLLPKDPNDDKNIIVEIRGAAGGDEANIFAGDFWFDFSIDVENYQTQNVFTWSKESGDSIQNCKVENTGYLWNKGC